MTKFSWFKVRDPFAAIDSSNDLRRAGRMSGFVIASAILRFGVYGLSAYWLTILIEPAEFGRLLQAGVPLAFLNLFGDFGLGDGVVRLKRVNAELSSLFFYLNSSFAALVCGLLIVLIPIFEIWFDGAELMDLGIVMGINLVVSGMAAQYRALMRRQMRFKAISGMEVVTSLLTNLIPIALAIMGLGVIAIPLGLLGASLANLVMMALLTGWIPGRPAKFSAAKSTMNFGFKLAASGVLHFGATAISAMLIGRVFSEEILGFLERSIALSKNVVGRFISLFGRFTFPIMARSRHGDPSDFKRLAKTVVRLLCIVTVVPTAVVASLASPVSLVIFGSEFDVLGDFLSLQWAAIVLAFLAKYLADVALAAGRSGLLLKINGVRFGLELAVLAFSILWLENLYLYLAVRVAVQCISTLVVSGLVSHVIGVRIWDFVLPSLLSLIFAGVSAVTIRTLVESHGLELGVVLGILIVGICIAIPIIFRRHFLEAIATANDVREVSTA
ncbi:MAG: hypothetical protein CMJ52_11565 [Planctomycetaceae bacterium]|nr:hypothetical protein [Planctomycetaceae bacterium]